MPKATWTESNIKVIVKPPNEKRDLDKLKEVWNKWLTNEIIKIINNFAKNSRIEVVIEIINRFKI